MASRSPLRNRKDLTNLTMEAMALVNEEIMGPAVTDEPTMLPAPDGDQEMDMAAMRDMIVGPKDDEPTEDYANAPEPEYGDMSDVIPDGNDLNRKKKAYPATQRGDNPMAVEDDSDDTSELEARIKEELKAALEGKYSKKKE